MGSDYRNLGSAVAAILLSACVLIFCTCGDDKATDSNNTSNVITPEGGTITDPGGATVYVPPGAVSENVAITITTYTCRCNLPSGGPPFLDFIGGADFGPDGQEFLVPVTITLPCNIQQTAGDSIPLYVYDELEDVWENSGFMAVVNSDGQSISAEVTHFSLFGNFGGGVFGNFRSDFGDGSTAEAAFQTYISWFHANVAYLNKRGTYESECQEAVGIFFDLSYDVRYLPDGPHYQGIPALHEGHATEHSASFVDSEELVIPGELDFNYILAVDVYLECRAPDLEATAEPSNIDIGETSTVTATLTCGDDNVGGKEVTFETAGGLGTLSTESATTSNSGQAQTVFTAEEEGTESILVENVSCDGSETANAGPTIEIGNDWGGTLTINFHQNTGGAGWDFSDNVTINFDLTIDSANVSGTGNGVHAMTLTPTEDCWFEDQVSPPFTVYADGTKSGDNIEFQIIPNSMPLSFTLVCPNDPPDPPTRIPIPIYSNLEASVMGQYITINLPLEDGATDSGSGSEGDPPLTWSYSVTLHQ